jgi:YfiH family protein
VHGTEVALVDAKTAGATPVADALVTTTRQLPLAVVTADCAPIVLAADDAIGVVHAGHRGLLGGVVERAVEVVRAHGAGPVRAYLAPCIRARHYEFGSRDLAAMVRAFGPVVASRTEWGTDALDMTAAVRVALERSGVDALDDSAVCTFESRDHFSYRRDGRTGRQATIAMLP